MKRVPLIAAAFAFPATLSAQGDLLYVCIQDEARIAVIDTESRTVRRMIDLTDLGFSPTAKPHHVASAPDGSAVFVSLIGDNRIIMLDANDRVVAQAVMETPGMLAVDPAHGILMVSRSMSAVNPPRRVGMVRLDGFDIEEIDVFAPRPHPMFTAGNGFAYTGSLGQNQLVTIDLRTETVELVEIEGPPHALVQFDVSPDGRTLVASTEVSGRLLVFDLADPARPSLVRSIDVGPTPFDPVFSPDGLSVWVPVKGGNEIAIVDAGNWTVTARIREAAFQRPHQIVFANDGRTAFVSNNGGVTGHADHGAAAAPAGEPGGLVIVDVASRSVTGSIPLGNNVTGLGLRARTR